MVGTDIRIEDEFFEKKKKSLSYIYLSILLLFLVILFYMSFTEKTKRVRRDQNSFNSTEMSSIRHFL